MGYLLLAKTETKYYMVGVIHFIMNSSWLSISFKVRRAD